MATMSPRRRRIIDDMTIRNLSPATQQSYLHAVSKFIASALRRSMLSRFIWLRLGSRGLR